MYMHRHHAEEFVISTYLPTCTHYFDRTSAERDLQKLIRSRCGSFTTGGGSKGGVSMGNASPEASLQLTLAADKHRLEETRPRE